VQLVSGRQPCFEHDGEVGEGLLPQATASAATASTTTRVVCLVTLTVDLSSVEGPYLQRQAPRAAVFTVSL